MQKKITAHRPLLSLAFLALMLIPILTGCAGWHPYDQSQVPVITVGEGDGFQNTRHRYVSKITFVASSD